VRYGMNPHQSADVVSDTGAVSVVSGEPSLINYLDALNAWQLAAEARAATGLPVAASFKHVSPAGVATAGPVDDTAQETWGVSAGAVEPLTSAYVRARDADPKSSFGDVIAVSHPVTAELADFVSQTIADAIIAPGYEAGTVATLSAKKSGSFLVLQADPDAPLPGRERRDLLGMTFEQDRDTAPIDSSVLGTDEQLSPEQVIDALVSMVTLRYTQSNSIVLVKDGISLGIGAGQQNRVDCVRLAIAKAHSWCLRRHPNVRELTQVSGMKRQDRLNWQIRFAEQTMTRLQRGEFTARFGDHAIELFDDAGWRTPWTRQQTGLTLGSDGFIPFRDNVDFAAEGGVTTIVEPGGSLRTPQVEAACQELGIRHIATGLRLFHH